MKMRRHLCATEFRPASSGGGAVIRVNPPKSGHRIMNDLLINAERRRGTEHKRCVCLRQSRKAISVKHGQASSRSRNLRLANDDLQITDGFRHRCAVSPAENRRSQRGCGDGSLPCQRTVAPSKLKLELQPAKTCDIPRFPNEIFEWGRYSRFTVLAYGHLARQGD
jgi:hypothetical protein